MERALPATNGIEAILKECCVTEKSLDASQKEALDRHGYLVLPDLAAGDWLARLRAAFERAMGEAASGGQTSPREQSGTRHAPDLAWKDAAFDCPSRCSNPRAAIPRRGSSERGLDRR